MKNKIAIASAFVAASSFSTAEIVVNDFLSFEGFVDMSYAHTDLNAPAGADKSSSSFQVDQVEIDWLFDFDTVTAQIDLEYEDGTTGPGGADGDTEVEQAFVTYHMDGGSAFTAGRYASMLGFEAFEPTGLYQFSFAYSAFAPVAATPGYAQGVKYTNEGDNTFFGISLQDSVGSNSTPDVFGDSTGFGVEVAGAYTMDNGVSFFLGGAYDDDDAGDFYVVNTYVTYETGAWLFAAELNYGDLDAAADLTGYSGLLMANFAYSDNASVTARASYFDNDGAGDADGETYTLAHGYAFTDNLFLVNEISYSDVEQTQGTTVAAELLFSF